MSDTFLLHNYLQKSPKYKEALSKRISSTFLKKGEYIYKPSVEVNVAYEVVSGVVKIGSYSKDGEECIYDVLKQGDVFGNLRYLDVDFHEFAKCLSDVQLRLYDLPFYKSIVLQDTNIAEWFNQYIVRRWCRVETRFFTVISEDILTRIQRLQRDLNFMVHDGAGKMATIFSLLSQKDIADLTGSTRQSVAQIFKKINNKHEAIKLKRDAFEIF